MLPRILIVDDEIANLRNTQSILQPMKNAWDVQYASSGEEALQMLAKSTCDIILCDIHIHDIDGSLLLNTVMNRHPHVVRFVLFDPQDNDAVIRASSLAHQFIANPPSIIDIKRAVKRALALRSFLAGDQLKKIISQIRELPGLPDIYLKIAKLLRANHVSVREVGSLIEHEPGLSARVLKVVNSAYYGLRQQVSSPTHAANLLGLEAIRSLVLMFDIFEHFDRIRALVPDFSLEAQQAHSLRVSSYAKVIMERQGVEKRMIDEVVIAGLLHDIGKLVLAQNFPKEYNQVLRLAREKNYALWMAESTVFGATHAEIGGYLLGLWGIADPIVEACALHHHPSLALQNGFSCITALHVADAFDREHDLRQLGAVKGMINKRYLEDLKVDHKLPGWFAACAAIVSEDDSAESRGARTAGGGSVSMASRAVTRPPAMSWWQRVARAFTEWVRS